MNALKSFRVLLLFAVASISIFNTCYAASSKWQAVGSKWRVTILNYQTDSPLAAHCRSKEDDLGERTLGVGEHFEWDFKENAWQTTLYWCNFGSNHGHASFQVFWPEKGTWLSQRCSFGDCLWAAKDDGFYLKNGPLGTFELQHPWG